MKYLQGEERRLQDLQMPQNGRSYLLMEGRRFIRFLPLTQLLLKLGEEVEKEVVLIIVDVEGINNEMTCVRGSSNSLTRMNQH